MSRTVLVLAGLVACAAPAASAAPPRLERQGTAMRLVVQGRPWLILGGELGNSSDSSAAYMAPHWPRLERMHLNTVFAPVSWELIEPVEGRFRWDSVDELIRQARAHQLRLVLLWFGAWKNSMSTYAPSWVKRDEARFPRARLPDGEALDILSAFASTTRDADARAFAALIGHIKAVDDDENTVLMVQVENEVGMLPVARDHSREAERRFHAPVPRELVRMLESRAAEPQSEAHRLWVQHGARVSGDWTALFGSGDAAAEVFTAWHLARYVEAIAAAGKAVYPLPMYVNAALNRPRKSPGEYPSGGPLPHLADIWKTAAPSLDLLAPDIYFPNFGELAERYARPDNPLFIPEANGAGKSEVAANAFYAIGKLDAIGFGPFSIESIDEREPNPLAAAYSVLAQLSPAILASEGLERMSGFRPRVQPDGTVSETPVTATLGEYRFTVAFVDPWTPRSDQDITAHGGIIIQTGPEDYLVAGRGLIVTFVPTDSDLAPTGARPGQGRIEQGGDPRAGIDFDWEGSFDAQGKWVPGRLLNGDQTNQGRYLRLEPGRFQIQRVRLYRYR